MKLVKMIYSPNSKINHVLRQWLTPTVMVLLILGTWIVIGLQVLAPSTSCHESSSGMRLSHGDTNPVRLGHYSVEFEVLQGPFEELCAAHSSLSEEDCQAAQRQKHVEKIQELNVVSAAPGSGNDWVLWLAAINDASWTRQSLENTCCIYAARRIERDDGSLASRCLFMKTHDPWWWNDGPWKNNSFRGIKAAVLLRHPVESALSQYKKMIVDRKTEVAKLKSGTSGLTLDQFFSNNMNNVTPKWARYSKQHISRWLSHARFWLETYKGSKPYIIIYKDLVEDTRNGLASLLMFFNMTKTEPNLKRSCCSAKYPFNTNLKRGTAPIDQYTSLLFERTPRFLEAADEAVNEVNKILKLNYPELSLVVRRG